ncbi:hypothetical protein RHMOL_Rhmol06G0226300 [Rhododendron molle]|uniref:Uncharacterized protein n=2 Tax=Rhododendron molle TaxID=49168 RepID=A0ACC0NF29_RHOML|nr:hypothetical protein RHMOL_Rhmol06G0226300 [Rhododendron molle]KAI8551943.1 hypothetical protein RHMOL_Rhmol06G0226300 [Rhododendron molle]
MTTTTTPPSSSPPPPPLPPPQLIVLIRVLTLLILTKTTTTTTTSATTTTAVTLPPPPQRHYHNDHHHHHHHHNATTIMTTIIITIAATATTMSPPPPPPQLTVLIRKKINTVNCPGEVVVAVTKVAWWWRRSCGGDGGGGGGGGGDVVVAAAALWWRRHCECYGHPYKAEIEALLRSPRVEFDEGNVDLELKESYVWIETEFQLEELVGVLSKERVFAVDTEQHSLRSFLGFTALIQISTRGKDYLVDTIALHDVMGILRPIFANSAICKVFHGADNDVLWLQRDFHIYVVNLFDTAKACEVLSKPQKSLAYLLETYCGVATNKQLQREDWRQRPLPVEMVQYARTDAHFLLDIARCLASELMQQDSACPDDKFRFVLEASRRSNAICLQLFSKEIEAFPGESAASSIMSRNLNDQGGLSPHSQDKQFQGLVQRLCAWRDLMARMHDESLRCVLSDHAIVALAHRV